MSEENNNNNNNNNKIIDSNNDNVNNLIEEINNEIENEDNNNNNNIIIEEKKEVIKEEIKQITEKNKLNGIIETTEDVIEEFNKLRKSFYTKQTISLEWRLKQLKQLKKMINDNKEEIISAVCKDLGKKLATEVQASEIGLVCNELDEAISNVKNWVIPEKVYTPLSSKPSSSFVYKDPLGVVLIISPWNYPFNLVYFYYSFFIIIIVIFIIIIGLLLLLLLFNIFFNL